jgi:hypothetical protein
MTELYAEVILFDNVGMCYDGNTMHSSGMGGSEFQAILLLEELVKLNKRIICLNNVKHEVTINGVLYLPNTYLNKYKFRCNNLIIHRYSDLPKIDHMRAFVWATDLNGPHNLKFYNYFEKNQLELVCLSHYQSTLFPNSWKKNVINFMIPDWVYSYEIPKQKSGYVYASSLTKGYACTLEYWKYLKLCGLLSNKKLRVCLPGYDNPDVDISMPMYDVEYLNTLPFKKVVEVISKSQGMFYVNTMPETFGISVILAEILQTPPYVLGINGLGALSELLNSNTITTDMKTFIDYFVSERSTNMTRPKPFKSEVTINKWVQILNI